MYKLPTILACLILLCGSAAAASKTVINIKGADTMVHLADFWAEKFMLANPNVQVVVTGGGSKPGIEGLLNGTVDIADTARPLDPTEIQSARSRNFDLTEYVVALDGISVIVHPGNPVHNLTMPQLKQIFTGEVDNWNKFGGPDQKIHLFIRDANSGIYVFFQKKVLKKSPYSLQAHGLVSNSAVIHEVANDEAGIGYVSLGYYANAQMEVRALRVQENEKSRDFMPSIETVTDGSYPISHKLRLVTKGKAAGPIKQFVDFVTSTMGQDIVEYQGCVRLSQKPVKK